MGMSRFEHDSHTGDAVQFAPVSSQIPCKQGIFQGNWDFRSSESRPWSRNALQYSTFRVNSPLQLTGKFPAQTGSWHGAFREFRMSSSSGEAIRTSANRG